MADLRTAAQQALEALKSCSAVPHWPALQPTITALRDVLAQQAEPAPGWCKHCKQYSIEEPLPAQQAEPTQTPCDIAEDGVCEVIDCCRNPPKQAEPVDNEAALRLAIAQRDWAFKQLWAVAVASAEPVAPPQRKPLTEEEISRIYVRSATHAAFARAIERAHGIGGDDGQA